VNEPANLDRATVEGFGDEWGRFDQTNLSDHERASIFDAYFSVFPWSCLPADPVGLDVGCGSGRWAAVVAPRVGRLVCVDASSTAAAVARLNLAEASNVSVAVASVDRLPVPDASLDFAYCLGVLHHVPDTAGAIAACARTLKPGAPILLYVYYRFDNRPSWFRALWACSDVIRRRVSRLPYGPRWVVSQVAALMVYLPLAQIARLGAAAGRDVDSWPLSFYRDRSVYVMRTDALDRFGTQLEQRFTRAEIIAMMTEAGLADLHFREAAPYWTVVGTRV
jgi:SAM-dependent methyltransferase